MSHAQIPLKHALTVFSGIFAFAAAFLIMKLDVGDINSRQTGSWLEYVNYVLRPLPFEAPANDKIVMVEIRETDLPADGARDEEGKPIGGSPPAYSYYKQVLERIAAQEPSDIFFDVIFPHMRSYDKTGLKFKNYLKELSHKDGLTLHITAATHAHNSGGGKCALSTDPELVDQDYKNIEFLNSTNPNNTAKGEKFRVMLHNPHCKIDLKNEPIPTFVEALYREAEGAKLQTEHYGDMTVEWNYASYAGKGSNYFASFTERVLASTDLQKPGLNDRTRLGREHFITPVYSISELSKQPNALKDKIVVLYLNHSENNDGRTSLLGYADYIPHARFAVMAVHQLLASDTKAYPTSPPYIAVILLESLFIGIAVAICTRFGSIAGGAASLKKKYIYLGLTVAVYCAIYMIAHHILTILPLTALMFLVAVKDVHLALIEKITTIYSKETH